jgi:hypothetical protein
MSWDLYPGRWVRIAGTKRDGYLVQKETHMGDDGWRVQFSEEWSAWVRVGDLIPWSEAGGAVPSHRSTQ